MSNYRLCIAILINGRYTIVLMAHKKSGGGIITVGVVRRTKDGEVQRVEITPEGDDVVHGIAAGIARVAHKRGIPVEENFTSRDGGSRRSFVSGWNSGHETIWERMAKQRKKAARTLPVAPEKTKLVS